MQSTTFLGQSLIKFELSGMIVEDQTVSYSDGTEILLNRYIIENFLKSFFM